MQTEFYEVGVEKETQPELFPAGKKPSDVKWDRFLTEGDLTFVQAVEIAEVLSENIYEKNHVIVKLKHPTIKGRWDQKHVVQGKSSEIPTEASLTASTTPKSNVTPLRPENGN